jgi:hypothetical protein
MGGQSGRAHYSAWLDNPHRLRQSSFTVSKKTKDTPAKRVLVGETWLWLFFVLTSSLQKWTRAHTFSDF